VVTLTLSNSNASAADRRRVHRHAGEHERGSGQCDRHLRGDHTVSLAAAQTSLSFTKSRFRRAAVAR
jgi:hypothetical protein